MKYISKQLKCRGMRYCFSFTKEELEILAAISKHYKKIIPEYSKTEAILDRLHDIALESKKTLVKIKKEESK